jgi:hypothetical protein
MTRHPKIRVSLESNPKVHVLAAAGRTIPHQMSENGQTTAASPPQPRHRALVIVLALAVWFALAAAVIASGKIPHRVAYDQLLYHSQVITTFAREWPRPDLSDYLSATTPGFHLLLAALVRVFGSNFTLQQCVCALITGIWLAAMLWAADRGALVRGRTREYNISKLATVLPLFASMYVFASGVYILPDNTAWLGVIALLILTFAREFTLQRLMLGGMVLLALTWVRQVHVWTAGLLIARAFLEGFNVSKTSHAWLPTSGSPGLMRALTNVTIAAAACLPAVFTIVYFYGLWGGLTPPTFSLQYHSFNPAGPAFILAVAGFFGCFFIGYILPVLTTVPRWAVIVGACVGALLALLPVTAAGTPDDYFAGRRTGLWDLAAKFPEVMGRTSPIIFVLASLGGAIIASYAVRWRLTQSIVMLCSVAGYSLAMSAGGELWQRYAEPFILMLYVMLIGYTPHLHAPGIDAQSPLPARARFNTAVLAKVAWLGPTLLAMIFALLTLRDLRKPGTQLITDTPPRAETPSAQVPVPRPDSPYSRYMIHKGLLQPRSGFPASAPSSVPP